MPMERYNDHHNNLLELSSFILMTKDVETSEECDEDFDRKLYFQRQSRVLCWVSSCIIFIFPRLPRLESSSRSDEFTQPESLINSFYNRLVVFQCHIAHAVPPLFSRSSSVHCMCLEQSESLFVASTADETDTCIRKNRMTSGENKSWQSFKHAQKRFSFLTLLLSVIVFFLRKFSFSFSVSNEKHWVKEKLTLFRMNDAILQQGGCVEERAWKMLKLQILAVLFALACCKFPHLMSHWRKQTRLLLLHDERACDAINEQWKNDDYTSHVPTPSQIEYTIILFRAHSHFISNDMENHSIDILSRWFSYTSRRLLSLKFSFNIFYCIVFPSIRVRQE